MPKPLTQIMYQLLLIIFCQTALYFIYSTSLSFISLPSCLPSTWFLQRHWKKGEKKEEEKING